MQLYFRCESISCPKLSYFLGPFWSDKRNRLLYSMVQSLSQEERVLLEYKLLLGSIKDAKRIAHMWTSRVSWDGLAHYSSLVPAQKINLIWDIWDIWHINCLLVPQCTIFWKVSLAKCKNQGRTFFLLIIIFTCHQKSNSCEESLKKSDFLALYNNCVYKHYASLGFGFFFCLERQISRSKFLLTYF